MPADQRSASEAAVTSLVRQAQARPDRSALHLLQGRQLLGSLHSDGAVPPGVERLTEPAEIAAALGELGRTLRTELVGMLPPSPDPAGDMASSRDADLELLDRGVSLSLLYEPGWLAVPAAADGIHELVAAGARARVVDRVPHRLLVCDRRLALLPLDLSGCARGAVIVREHSVVTSLRTLFASAWRSAVDVADHDPGRPAEAGEQDREVLELMSLGVTDDVAARKIGVSVRTYRRYVADLMHRLGASSRFQAGVTAVQRGWL